MLLYKVFNGAVVFHEEKYFSLAADWDDILQQEPLYDYLLSSIKKQKPLTSFSFEAIKILAPIGKQEVWAAGVTWLRSKEARMDESESSGAAVFYDLVYDAPRPELFFKATSARVAGHGDTIHIRRDSKWNVPEPELTLYIGKSGSIQAYTIGNDVSSRSIEGENPLYLPQAKSWQWSAALGPCLLVTQQPVSPATVISMEVVRGSKVIFNDSVSISKMKRTFADLVHWLFLECDFPNGCFLMTGTCLVPGDEFTLQKDDVVNIRIDGIGLLSNTVSSK